MNTTMSLTPRNIIMKGGFYEVYNGKLKEIVNEGVIPTGVWETINKIQCELEESIEEE